MENSGKILLHVCCGPCATASIERLLEDGRKADLFYSNSNIAPHREYLKRLEGVKQVASYFNIDLIEDDYRHDLWLEAVRGLENEPERGRRCVECFRFSLRRTSERAFSDGYGGYTTTLTVSPHKDSTTLFSVGNENSGFVEYNFKKKDGYKRSIELSKKLDLYRQNYCGCEFSLRR